MPTTLDYAYFAANAYSQSGAVVSPENTIPVPDGWTLIEPGRQNPASGFLGRAYKNAAGEIVIAYGGTTFEGGTVDKLRDWLYGNVPAGAGFALPRQVVDAAMFYLDIAAANPTAPAITFTGHSLGGGLASLMSVFFNRHADTFDSAPFKKAADSLIVVRGLKNELLAAGYSLPPAFANYLALDPLAGSFLPSPTRLLREGNVTHTYLKDEALEYLRGISGRVLLTAVGATHPALAIMAANVANIAGSESFKNPMARNGNGWGFFPFNGNPIDMHSMSLLTAFLQAGSLEAASQAHPELLQKLFTSSLNVDRNGARRNIIDLFVQREKAGERAWQVVAEDVQRLTGSVPTGALAAALVNLDLGMNYGQGLDRANGVASGAFENMIGARIATVLLGFCMLPSCGGEEIKWTEDVQLRDGKVIQLKRRTELSGSGFPVSQRGFHQYHELCYAPLNVYWKSKPEYPPEVFELDGGRAYVKVTLLSFDICGLHGYPKDDALYFVRSGAEWQRIDASQFPRGARFNLLQNPTGQTAAQDARGAVGQAEKEKRDGGLYYTLKLASASSLNEIPPYKGICTKYPVDKSVKPPPTTTIFLGSQSKRCD